MKLRIVKAGKPAFAETRALCRTYEKRIRGFAKCEALEIKELKDDAGRDFLTRTRDKGGYLVVLDERGESWSSDELARRVGRCRDDNRVKSMTFLIGGPYGLTDELRDGADAVWSLSKATFPSDLAWVLCFEQVYRALNILQGTSYHHA